MTSSWRPSEGMRRAEMLVQVLEAEAIAADAKITPLFRHRMVEQIGKAIDNAMPTQMPITNGHAEEIDEAFDTLIDQGLVEVVEPEPTPKPARGRPAKPGKRRGRPSNAEKAAIAAAGRG